MVAGSLEASGYRASGYTLIELLFVVALTAILAAIAVPESRSAVDRARAASAARYLASRMAVARSQAVMRSAHVALRFEDRRSGMAFKMYVDGNHNGVRTGDITTGVDVLLEPAVRLGDLHPGLSIAIAGEDGTDSVRLGPSNLLSFTPLGTSTPGSIFVRGRDGSQFAVRVLGATGRVRVERFVPHSRTWIDGF